MKYRSSTAKRLVSFIAAISVMTLCAAPSVFAVPPNTVFLPDFSKELLAPPSQAATAWTNVIPNALASYYTFTPYSNADAIALGFPAACGNKALPGLGDTGSTADCYTITVRKLGQPMSLDFLKYVGIPGFPGKGLIKGDGVTPFADTTSPTLPANFLNPAITTLTTAWGYGSGGNLWTPPYQTVVPAKVVTGNAPPAFAAVTFSTLFGPGAYGAANPTHPADTGIWHWPAPSIKGTKNRPIYVQWLNDLPNERPQGHDPSVDCGLNAPFCFPYNRIITHVHGAHVTPESDGLATAWFTPYTPAPNYLQGENAFLPAAFTGYGTARNTYKYPMTQEAGTVWYHDHAVGTTHLNTNMGMAGFLPVTDLSEQSLLTPLLGPAKALPNTLYDFGFALQDRNFDVTGQTVMPDYGIYNKADPACTLTIDGLPDPLTCPRLQWMKALDGHKIPYVVGSPLLLNANNIGTANLTGPYELPGQGAPFPATSATLEYFGNMPVVNGVTYGKIDVEQRINRLRFVGGTDSRTWIMQLRTVVAGVVSPTIVPFYQIGSDQGLLNKPVLRNEIDLMGGERVDVLVDFSALAPGTKVRMINLGGDTPYSGYQDYKAGAIVRSADIPEIMEFNVLAKSGNLDSTPIATLLAAVNPLRPGTIQADGSGLPIAVLTLPAVTRNVSLIEITDQYGRTMPTIDGRGFIPPGVPITEIILPNRIEQWDIINTTVDAHPMHIHQVAFQAVDRQAIDFFVAPGADILNQNFTPPTYVPVGVALPADAWDIGVQKDTIQSPPGYVTRVRMVFDLLGDYVWHCHILSHEEHDMMRPFTVTTVAPAPRFINVPADNTTGRFTASWGGTSIPGAQFVLQQKIAPAAVFTTVYTGTATSVNLFKTIAGTYSYQVGVIAPPFTASTFTTVPNNALTFSPTATVTVGFPTTMLTPANLAIFAGTSQTFTWANTGAARYSIWVGSTPGAVDLGNLPTGGTSVVVSGLPVDGRTVYVRLWTLVGATWAFNDYTYTAKGNAAAAVLNSPANLSTLAGASQTFTWTAKAGALQYSVWVGTFSGASNLGNFPTGGTSVVATGLPVNGTPVYVRLWTLTGAGWIFNDYTYTASGIMAPAAMITPANNAILVGPSQTLTWNNTGAAQYAVWVGTTVGSSNLGNFPTGGTSVVATGFPGLGAIVKVRLWTLTGAGWTFNDYSYTSN